MQSSIDHRTNKGKHNGCEPVITRLGMQGIKNLGAVILNVKGVEELSVAKGALIIERFNVSDRFLVEIAVAPLRNVDCLLSIILTVFVIRKDLSPS